MAEQKTPRNAYARILITAVAFKAALDTYVLIADELEADLDALECLFCEAVNDAESVLKAAGVPLDHRIFELQSVGRPELTLIIALCNKALSKKFKT